jgi:hypothetical protein
MTRDVTFGRVSSGEQVDVTLEAEGDAPWQATT